MRAIFYLLLLSCFVLPISSLEAKNDTDLILAEVSIGELVDKITILNIKMERIKDNDKLQNIKTELDTLLQTLQQTIAITPQLETLMQELTETNTKLWDIEDDIRSKEKNQQFDAEFITLARGVYFTNDHRCAIKRTINELYGSRIIEEKGYTKYTDTLELDPMKKE